MDLLDALIARDEDIVESIKRHVDAINKQHDEDMKPQLSGKSCIYCDSFDITCKENSLVCNQCHKISKIVIEDDSINSIDIHYRNRYYNYFTKEQLLQQKEKMLEDKFSSLTLAGESINALVMKDCIKNIMILQSIQHRKSPIYGNIQAAMLYLTFFTYGEIRSIKTICSAMNINSVGFNEGYKIVMTAIYNKTIRLTYPEKDMYKLYIKHYLTQFKVMSLPDRNYYGFACDMVNYCLVKNIGSKSNIITKCCGIVYYILMHHQRDKIDSQLLDAIFDVKMQTYKKFYTHIITLSRPMNEAVKKIYDQNYITSTV
jgi:hypothetical protein